MAGRFRKFARARIAEIQEAVAKECGVPINSLLSEDKSREFAYPRQLAMWLSRDLVGAPFVEIGKAFGNRDHSTIIKGIQNCDRFCTQDAYWRDMRRILISRFEGQEKACQ